MRRHAALQAEENMDAISKRLSERFSEPCTRRLPKNLIPLAAVAPLSLSG